MIYQQGTPVWHWNSKEQVIYAEVQSSAIMPDVRVNFFLSFYGLTMYYVGDSPSDHCGQ